MIRIFKILYLYAKAEGSGILFLIFCGMFILTLIDIVLVTILKIL
jgi:TM2 domain-containing membrane protein YozV